VEGESFIKEENEIKYESIKSNTKTQIGLECIRSC